MFRVLGRTVRSGLVIGAFAVVAPAANAAHTVIHSPIRRNEVSHERILEHVYGGDFVKDAAGLNFSNESGVTVMPLDDGPGDSGNPALGGVPISVRAVAASIEDGMDHLVTYNFDGTPWAGQPAPIHLRCGESVFARRSDRDDNALMVEVQAAELTSRAALAQPLLIPLPPGAWTGLGGFVGVGVVLYRARYRPQPRLG